MLEQAWHVVTATDPLLDSDEEMIDENVRLDYSRRLSVINRLRGRSPTPNPFEHNVRGASQKFRR
jgi:Ino eighty subunit 1